MNCSKIFAIDGQELGARRLHLHWSSMRRRIRLLQEASGQLSGIWDLCDKEIRGSAYAPPRIFGDVSITWADPTIPPGTPPAVAAVVVVVAVGATEEDCVAMSMEPVVHTVSGACKPAMEPSSVEPAPAVESAATEAASVTTAASEPPAASVDLDDRQLISGRMKSDRCRNGAYSRKSDRECSEATRNKTITHHFNSPSHPTRPQWHATVDADVGCCREANKSSGLKEPLRSK